MEAESKNPAVLNQEEISGFVMAGGRSSRLGQDKVLLAWNGGTLLGHAIQQLERICKTVRVCTSRDDLRPHLPPSQGWNPGSLIRDALPDAGPLAGIVPALEGSQTTWNFFLAVDLPLVPIELLQTLALRAHSSANDGLLAIIPTIDGMPQPLCGLYHRSLAAGLRSALESGKYKLMMALQEAVRGAETANPSMSSTARELFDVREFASAIASKMQPDEWFLNVNTPQEWQRAIAIASRAR